MAQLMNTEIRGKLQTVTDYFKEELFQKMKGGIESAKECADQAGVGKLSRSCDAAAEGTDAMIKVFSSLVECCEKYNEYLKRTEDALA